MPDKQEAQSAVITGIELDNWTVHVNIHSIHSSAERNIFSSAERNILQLQSDTRGRMHDADVSASLRLKLTYDGLAD